MVPLAPSAPTRSSPWKRPLCLVGDPNGEAARIGVTVAARALLVVLEPVVAR